MTDSITPPKESPNQIDDIRDGNESRTAQTVQDALVEELDL